MRALSLAALTCLVASPLMAGPFDGLYRPLGASWDCQSVGADGGALEIRDGMFVGLVADCTLANPTPVKGMDAVLYDADCKGEGMTHSFRMMLMEVPEGLAMIQDGSVSLLERCE